MTFDLSNDEKTRINDFIASRQQFYETWFNGTVDQSALEDFGKKMHDDWLLVNKQTPALINTKELFLRIWPSMHARTKDTPIKQTAEIRYMRKLSPTVALVTIVETTAYPDRESSRPVTLILQLSDPIKTLYVHESNAS